jgi:hypothetical protein
MIHLVLLYSFVLFCSIVSQEGSYRHLYGSAMQWWVSQDRLVVCESICESGLFNGSVLKIQLHCYTC